MALSLTQVASLDRLPLRLHERTLLAKATDDGRTFSLVAGLDTDLIGQLKKYSLNLEDTELQKTSDYMRFGEGSYDEWYGSKERTMFALVDDRNGKLAALAWFGPKPLGRKSMKHLSEEERARDESAMDSGAWHTIVYRSYPPYRGTGLMTSFLNYVMDAYARCYPGSKLWAGIFAANPASLGFAKKLGFRIVEESSGDGHDETILVKE